MKWRDGVIFIGCGYWWMCGVNVSDGQDEIIESRILFTGPVINSGV